jgi:pSer/pThr/pTyr-binding forkhead associated (FHA) protein
MILCPNCHHQEVAGALFCSECGAQLVSSDRMATQSIPKNTSEILIPALDNAPATNTPVPPAGVPDAVVSLYLVDSGQIIHLAGRSEFTLGRVADNQPILPDVDFSAFEAYSQGVSRLHASLKIINSRVVITDLGSSNGTRVNGQKIMPHIDYLLNHGDVIALGKLKIQVLIRK